MRRHLKASICVAAALVLLAASLPTFAERKDVGTGYELENVHVMDPKTRLADARRQMMDQSKSLGVKCRDCHNPKDRDKLRLASGRLVSFKRSYLLCGQCHGPKLRDWRAGVHGKRTGHWKGKKEYRLCVHCHVPHSPRFKQLKPKPRPRRPAEIR